MTDLEKEEEFERRRREHASPAQKVVEEFMLESMDSTTEHLPSKAHETRLSLREIMMTIDAAIHAGDVIPYPEYVGYWRRWMTGMRYFIKLRARARMQRERPFFEALLAEHKEYYAERNLRCFPSPSCEKEWSKTAQAGGKLTYHKKAKPVRGNNGMGPVIKKGELTYQADPASFF